jgi:hypothetical protein
VGAVIRLIGFQHLLHNLLVSALRQAFANLIGSTISHHCTKLLQIFLREAMGSQGIIGGIQQIFQCVQQCSVQIE